MGSLTVAKDDESVVAATLDNIGVYLAIGLESNFLPAGRMQWQRGPDLPAYATGPCAVVISSTSFLLMNGGNIWEFDSSVAGPTSNEGWLESNRWPTLKTSQELRMLSRSLSDCRSLLLNLNLNLNRCLCL